MPMPHLTKIRKNAELHKVFLAYLKSKQIINLYKAVLTLGTPEQGVPFFTEKTNSAEKAFLGKLSKVMLVAWSNAKQRAENEAAANNQTLNPDQLHERIMADRLLEKHFYEMMRRTEQLFEDLSKGDEFLKSKPYKAYIRKAIKKEDKALKKDLKLEAAVDDIIGLAFAVEAGNDAEARKLADLIAETDAVKNKTKKKTKGSAVIAMMKKAMVKRDFISG
jgi:hypothetical protein